LGVPALPAKALDLHRREAVDAYLAQRLLHVVELERLDDRFNLLHCRSFSGEFAKGLTRSERESESAARCALLDLERSKRLGASLIEGWQRAAQVVTSAASAQRTRRLREASPSFNRRDLAFTEAFRATRSGSSRRPNGASASCSPPCHSLALCVRARRVFLHRNSEAENGLNYASIKRF